MAAFTLENMSGYYKLVRQSLHLQFTRLTSVVFQNKHLTINMEEMLTVQKVSWLTRKAVMNAPSIYVTVTHDASNFNVVGELAGLSGSKSEKKFNGECIETKDPLAGPCRMTPRLISLGELNKDYFKGAQISPEHLQAAWKGIDPATKLIVTSLESTKDGGTSWDVSELHSITVSRF